MVNRRTRFWLEAVAAVVSLLGCVVTLLVPTWIETVFGVDPDGGSGAIEWVVVGVSAVVACMASLMAYREGPSMSFMRRPRSIDGR